MRSATIPVLLLLIALPVAAQEAIDPARAYIEEFLPSCPEPPIVEERDYSHVAPEGMKAKLLIVKGDDPGCGGMYLRVRKDDRIYVGQPWILNEYEGSVPGKMERFAWERLDNSAVAEVSDRKTPEGLLEAAIRMTTSWGKLELEGAVDPKGTVFFPGGFDSIVDGARAARLEVVQEVIANAPQEGNGDSSVQLIEFSDFQCPSCRRANEWMTDILEEYGDRISYHRIDYPLMSSHPWAFSAALFGRAIARQSPEAFWRYKSEVYQNQSSLTTFTIDQFARDFVRSSGLAVDTFEADVASAELRNEILAGVSAGMIAEINGTPTFWVNGQPVAAGPEGEYLAKVLDAALEQTSRR